MGQVLPTSTSFLSFIEVFAVFSFYPWLPKLLLYARYFPFSESSRPNPLNAYGHLKIAGEEVTMAASEWHAVLRIPILFGEVEYLEESAVTVLLKVRWTNNLN